MFDVARLANGRVEMRTHGWQPLNCHTGSLILSLWRVCVCVRETEKARERERERGGEREKERMDELRVKFSWALPVVQTTLSFGV